MFREILRKIKNYEERKVKIRDCDESVKKSVKDW